METSHRTAHPVLVVLLWLVLFPAPAVGGYDIAHIVKRTCEPGGSLIVADPWKGPRYQDQMITEPGEVIACPPAGVKNSFQIASGSERIGRERYLCTYFSLRGGDGADSCSADADERAESFVEPLMAIRTDESGRMALSGIASDEVATVAMGPVAAIGSQPTVVAIDRQRASRLGATQAFGYFSIAVGRRSLCAEAPARVVARDRSGQRIAESTVSRSTRLLDGVDRVPYAVSLKALCESPARSQPLAARWLTMIGAVIRSLVRPLF